MNESEDQKHLKHFIAIFIVIAFTFYHAIVIIGAKHSVPKQNPPSGSIKPDVLYYNDGMNSKDLDKYLSASIPVIIKGIPKLYFNSFDNYDKKINIHSKKVNVGEYILPELDENLKKLINNLTKMSIVSLTTMFGNYPGGYAHLDSLVGYNMYYLKTGAKQVWIVPEEYSNNFEMGDAVDNIYVKEDAVDTKHMQWLNKIPYHFSFVIEEGDLLIFNSSKTIHKFKNKTGNESVYSLRLHTTDGSPIVFKHNLFNWELSKTYAYAIIHKVYERDPFDYH